MGLCARNQHTVVDDECGHATRAHLVDRARGSVDTVLICKGGCHLDDALAVKPDRSPVEYLWTSTPALPLYMFSAHPELDEVTYLDADLMFFSDPQALLEAALFSSPL